MKKGISYMAFAMAMGIIFAACGGGGGGDSSSSSGTLSMNITDAKPFLPVSNVESVSITFNEVSVHKSGGGWNTLATATQPYTIDLYQFSNGAKTQFVPAVQAGSGKYTQVRIGVTKATIKFIGVDQPVDLEIPSENLKTDKNFEFDVQGGGAVDLTVDFDLSQSIVATGTGTYQLKPVLHIVETKEAAAIEGTIKWKTPAADGEQVTIIVTWDKYNENNQIICQEPNPSDPNTDEVYTKILVQESDPSPFNIFWLVPGEGYFVQVLWGNPDNPKSCSNPIYVAPGSLGPGVVHGLGEVNPS